MRASEKNNGPNPYPQKAPHTHTQTSSYSAPRGMKMAPHAKKVGRPVQRVVLGPLGCPKKVKSCL